MASRIFSFLGQMAVVFGLAILLVPITGQAEGDDGYVIRKRKDGTTIKYKQKNTYDFEGANIDGMYNKPSGSYISNIKDVKARTIIKIRKNFDAEVVDTARMIQ